MNDILIAGISAAITAAGFVLAFLQWRHVKRAQRKTREREAQREKIDQFYRELSPLFAQLRNGLSQSLTTDQTRFLVSEFVRVASTLHFGTEKPPPPADPSLRCEPGLTYNCSFCDDSVTPLPEGACPHCGLCCALWTWELPEGEAGRHANGHV